MKKTAIITFFLLICILMTSCSFNLAKDPADDETDTTEGTDTNDTATTDKGGEDPDTGDEPYDEPDVPDDTVLHSGLYEYDLTQYINPIPYADLCIEKAYLDKQIEDEVDSFVTYYGEYKDYDDAEYKVATGDIANIFFTGRAHDPSQVISESALAGMTNVSSEDGTDLEIGSNTFIVAYTSETNPEKNNPGFEDQIIGHKKGDSFTITVTIPDNYRTEELQGAVIDFDITINSVSRFVKAEFNDETVREYTDYQTAEEFLDGVREYYIRIDAYEGILDSVVVTDFPDKSVDVEDIIVEFIFKDLELELTQGKFEEMVNEHYEIYGLQYYYYYGIASCKDFVDSIGKDSLIMFFERDLVQDKLVQIINVV